MVSRRTRIGPGLSRCLLALSLIALSDCHDESPTQPRTLTLSTSFPSALRQRDEFTFSATLTNTSIINEWEYGSVVYGIPEILSEAPTVLATNGTDVEVFRGSPESGGWEILVGASPYRPGGVLWFTAHGFVAADAGSGNYTTQVQGAGLNGTNNHQEEDVFASDRVLVGGGNP